jgi:hypothetical protein
VPSAAVSAVAFASLVREVKKMLIGVEIAELETSLLTSIVHKQEIAK